MEEITFDARLISSSGIGVYIQNIIKILLRDYKFRLKLLYRKTDLKYFEDLTGDFELKEYEAGLYSVKELIETPFKTIKTKIFWSPHFNVPFLNFASGLKISTIHDTFHLAFYDSLSLKQKIYAKNMFKKAVGSSDLVFTVSQFSKTEILKFIDCDADKIKVVANGIDYHRFNKVYQDEIKADVCTRLGLTKPYILFVGNVKPHKNLLTGLKGFKEFVLNAGTRFSDLKFVIVGRKEGFVTGDNSIEKLLSDPFFQKNVRFTDWVNDEDLPVLYQEAFLFMFPSLYEGFGFPPLEAMAAGCPVIASNGPCMREIYENAVQYFDPYKVSSVAEALSIVAESLNVRLILKERGYGQAMKYKWEKAVAQKVRAISELVGEL